jgi:SAM-dependent methyltransferase
MNIITKCPVCTSTKLRYKWEVNGYKIVRCSTCHLIFVNPQPREEILNELYSENYFDKYQDEDIIRCERNRCKHDYILDVIEKYVHVGRLLEVGAAFGDFLLSARSRGWEVKGVEKSECGCTQMRKKELPVFKGDLLSVGLGRGIFDAVVCDNTIEHLLDPKGFVIEIYRILRDGGVFFVRTPDIGSPNAILHNFANRFIGSNLWSEIRPPEHLFYFSKSTLSRLLRSSDFEVSVIHEYNRKTYADVNFNNKFLAFSAFMLRPFLRFLDAEFEMNLVARKVALNEEQSVVKYF